MIIVAGTLRLPQASVAEILPFARETLAASRRDAGCIAYSYAFDAEDGGLLHIFEQWESRADLDNHLAQPHMGPWRAKLAEVGATDRDLWVHEVESSAQL